MSATLITPPASEPIGLDDVKLHSRIDTSDEDALLTLLIGAARRHAENACQRAFITQTWAMSSDTFPGDGFQLPRCPVQSVSSITYTDTAGVTQTLDPSLYKVDAVSEPARIVPAYGATWPATRSEINAVTVTYISGYGDAAADVPEGIRHWLLLRVATAYENREEVAILQKGKIEALPFVDGLLDPYRLVSY